MADSKHRGNPPRPGAASLAADAESGDPGDTRRRSLYALDAMLKRGLIDRETYAARRKAIESESL